jgi:hypothetical protein
MKVMNAVWVSLVLIFTFLFLNAGSTLSAETVYDCNAPENLHKPVTIEIALSHRFKDKQDEVRRAFQSRPDPLKVRTKIFPFLDPPANIGIGKCVPAETARLAIRESIQYYGRIDQLIRQDILPHHWIKIGATDLPELTWIPISPDELTHLMDPQLSTEQFQELYRQLATQKVKKLPFGMGYENLPASTIEILLHEWHPDTVWEKIGKTKFVWKATVRNNSGVRQRVYVYYDLLDAQDVPLARNVANQYIEPHQTVEVISDSYILSADLPNVKSSRATAKIWSPK